MISYDVKVVTHPPLTMRESFALPWALLYPIAQSKGEQPRLSYRPTSISPCDVSTMTFPLVAG